MTTAPAFDCRTCTRRIGRTTHYLLADGRVVCRRCAESRPMHATAYPDCPDRWHDLLDHLRCVGTRAGIAAHLGLWP